MIFLLLFLAYAILLSLALAWAGHHSHASTSAGVAHKRPERILVVGATGGTGRQLIEQALEHGYTVTALVRAPSKLQVVHPRLTVIQGNVLNPTAVDQAVRGQDAVLCALGHKRYFYPTRILSKGTQNILNAMETHDVHRLVCETSLGIGDSAGRLGLYYTLFTIPVVLPFYFWDKTRQEKIIANSSVEWVIVRPGVLTNSEHRGRLLHGKVGSYLLTVRISRADVAGFMLAQIASDTFLRTAPGVCW